MGDTGTHAEHRRTLSQVHRETDGIEVTDEEFDPVVKQHRDGEHGGDRRRRTLRGGRRRMPRRGGHQASPNGEQTPRELRLEVVAKVKSEPNEQKAKPVLRVDRDVERREVQRTNDKADRSQTNPVCVCVNFRFHR